MMSAAEITRLQERSAARAAELGRKPFVVWPEDLANWRADLENGTLRFPFPDLGSYTPEGWILQRRLFCDSSGFGRPEEPALTPAQLLEEIEPGKGYAIIETGQFQLYIGEFSKGEVN